jgi:hypothetical protein
MTSDFITSHEPSPVYFFQPLSIINVRSDEVCQDALG